MLKYQRFSKEELKTNVCNDTLKDGGVSTHFTNQLRILKLAAQLVEFKFEIKKYERTPQFDLIIEDEQKRQYKIKIAAYITTGEQYQTSNNEDEIYMAFPMDNGNPEKNWVVVPHKKLVEIFPYEQVDGKKNYQKKSLK